MCDERKRHAECMRGLDFTSFEALADEFDGLVRRTPEIDAFCSSTPWVIPAKKAYAPHSRPFIRVSDAGFIAMMKVSTPEQLTVATPLEMGWGLASPFAGPDPDRLAALLYTAWRRDPNPADALLLSGLPVEGVWRNALTKRFLKTHRVGIGSECCRRSASLQGGVEGFLSRRSPRFRRNLRRAWRKAMVHGITFEMFEAESDLASAFERILAIEAQSWKGRAGEGMDNVEPAKFYRDMIQRLNADNRLWLLFAREGDMDIGFIFGGVLGHTYRGLQVSFHQDYAQLEVGNLLQLAMVSELSKAGIQTYDLGTDIPYKRRWADSAFTTVTFAILPHW